MEVTIELIKEKVCENFGINTSDLSVKSSKRIYSDPRKVICYLAIKLLQYPRVKLGQELGGMDHSTVIYHRQVCDDMIEVDAKYRRRIKNIESQLAA